MITVRALQELLNKLPQDMPIYWVRDGKVPIFNDGLDRLPIWITLDRRDKSKVSLMLGMFYPTFLERDSVHTLALGGSDSLYTYVTELLPKKDSVVE